MLGACANSSNDVIAFEPDPPVHAALQQNIDVNSLRDRITAFLMALSSTVGMASLFIPSQEHGLIESSSSLEASFKNSHSEVRRVQVDTLDRFLENPAFSQKGISLIKIDVEGHEASVLAGAHATVAKWRPILFVEVLDRADFASLSSFIAQHNYVDVPLRAEGALTAQGIVTYDQTALNHVLVPPERLAEFLRFSRLA
jgi:FkbM family methyltransferase